MGTRRRAGESSSITRDKAGEKDKVTIREHEQVVNSSIAVTRFQSSRLLHAGSGSEDSLVVVRRKRKRFELTSDGEDFLNF